ncbi:hypothetical protein LGM46_20675 [Burkholderia arboris]|uniref:hypothetical protein n=1 Tax=Burkholderia cepacia complex TaxID=87882 RepID=UPI00069D484B|nr:MULTISPECIES: hypothetical protein [Burkholderia cepacia complex]MCA8035384.1 hypothetical protein [Burkholderia arboris]
MDYPKSVPGVGLVGGKFVDEDPNGQIGSLIPSKWGNDLTDEVLNVLREAGINPDEATTTQLRDAVLAIAQRSVAGSIASQVEAEAGEDNTKLMTPLRVAQATENKQEALGFTPVQQGTGIDQSQNTVKIGWKEGVGLKATVDDADLGAIAFREELGAYASQQWVRDYAAHKGGDTITGRVTIARDGWQADFALANRRPGQSVATYLRAADGGGIEGINSAYDAVTWRFDDWGNLHLRGQMILQPDGNLWLSWRGRQLSAEIDDIRIDINNRAAVGARVQWDSGVNNFGAVSSLNGALPAPWVVCGLSGPGNGTANAIVVYGVVLRNQ